MNAHTTETMVLGEDQRIEAASLIQDLNLAITWLRYPGRTNGTAPAEAVNFAVPGGTQAAA